MRIETFHDIFDAMYFIQYNGEQAEIDDEYFKAEIVKIDNRYRVTLLDQQQLELDI